MHTHILRLLIHLCISAHMDPLLVQSVIQVESGWNASLVGEANEQGLMQLLPSSFPEYSIEQLQDVNTNLRLGINYLAKMRKECPHQVDIQWVTCYNRGVSGYVKDPKRDRYYNKVLTIYKQLLREHARFKDSTL